MATLSPFYNSRTVVYLPDNSPPPLIVPSPSRRPFLLYQNTPIMGCLSRLAFHGVLYSFEGPSIPESTHFNYPSSSKRLPSPLLSRRLAVSLASFSSLDYLSIMWGTYRNVRPRVWGVDRSLHSPLFSSSSFDLRSRCRLPNVPGVHTHGPISTISFVLMSRATCLIIRSSPNLSLFLATSQSISPVD